MTQRNDASRPAMLAVPHKLPLLWLQDKCAYLFVASANDKQWPKGEKVLRQVVDSFTV